VNANDAFALYGFATAEAFVQLLTTAGPNPTRVGLMKAARSWNQPNQFLYPGIRQKTGLGDQFPIGCLVVSKWSGTGLVPVSQVKCETQTG
jgi:hypothetical protein